MAEQQSWRAIVASSLDWEQAHINLHNAVANLEPALRGKPAPGLPHTVWQLVDHIRRTLHDLLEFCASENYHEPKWPDDYWPPNTAPANDAEWTGALDAIRRDNEALAKFTMDESHDLTAKIPHGTGQTYLRTVLVAVDHTHHHVAQIIDVRRVLGVWPPSK